MQPIEFIITHLFGVNNVEFGRWFHVPRETVYKWTRGVTKAPLSRIRPILARLAAERGLPWSDSWLFEVPVCNQCVGPDQCGAGCARIVAGCATIRGGDVAGGLAQVAQVAGCGGCVGFAHGPVLSGSPPSVCCADTSPVSRGEEVGALERDVSDVSEGGNGKDGGDFPSSVAQPESSLSGMAFGDGCANTTANDDDGCADLGVKGRAIGASAEPISPLDTQIRAETIETGLWQGEAVTKGVPSPSSSSNLAVPS